jgi:hypothetical protein
VLEYVRVLVPPARNLASYKKQFGTDWKPDVTIPNDFRKVGKFEKGDIVRIPLDANGEVLSSSKNMPSHILPYRLLKFSSKGQLTFTLAEFLEAGIKDSPWASLQNFIKKSPSSPSVLAAILRFNHY